MYLLWVLMNAYVCPALPQHPPIVALQEKENCHFKVKQLGFKTTD